jgi:hypothetical protein
MGKVYISFYDEVNAKHNVKLNRLKFHLQDIDTQCKIIHWLHKIKDKKYVPDYYDIRGKREFNMPNGVYLNEEDAIIFKLMFGL